MTESRIRELLEDVAQPVDSRDLADVAWQTARHDRTRLRIGLAAAVVLVVAGGTAIGVAAGQHDHSAPAASRPSSSGVRRVENGVTIQIAPGVSDEAKLQPADGGLPAKIQLDQNAPWITDKPIDRVTAAFLGYRTGSSKPATFLVLVADDYTQRRLDISQLGPSPDSANGASPFTAGSLSPDGSELAFGQVGAIAVYAVQTRSWRRFPVRGFTADHAAALTWDGVGTVKLSDQLDLDVTSGSVTSTGDIGTDGTIQLGGRPKPPTGVAVSQWWGPLHDWGGGGGNSAEAAYVTSPTVPGDSEPLAIVAFDPIPAVLLIPLGADPVRYKGCCVVAGWQGGTRVVYESRSGDVANGQTSRLISWNLFTGELRLVSTVTCGANQVFIGTYAEFFNS
ncbi:MAG: hypothetical protein ACR2KJ_11090 [Jatrophihabitans sp.]